MRVHQMIVAERRHTRVPQLGSALIGEFAV
jgi:hypothetical protein